jgi:hypothetical protein
LIGAPASGTAQCEENIEHPTSNAEHPMNCRSHAKKWMLDVRCWALDVLYFYFIGYFQTQSPFPMSMRPSYIGAPHPPGHFT